MKLDGSILSIWPRRSDPISKGIWMRQLLLVSLKESRNRQPHKLQIRHSCKRTTNIMNNMVLNPPTWPMSRNSKKTNWSSRTYYHRKSITVKSSTEIIISIQITVHRIQTFTTAKKSIHRLSLCAQAPTLLNIIKLMKKSINLTSCWTQKLKKRLNNNNIWKTWYFKRCIRSQSVVISKQMMGSSRDTTTQLQIRLSCCNI